MKTVILFALIAALAGAESVPDQAFFAGNEEMGQYLDEAAGAHPALKARHAVWMAALEAIPQARSLEDPMFSYQQFVTSRMARFSAMISQSFPWFGTLKLQGKQASQEAEAAEKRMFAERNRVFLDVKDAYFEYAFIYGQIAVVEAQIDLVAYTEEVVQAKYALALAGQDELLRIQIQRATLDDLHQQLTQMIPPTASRLNEALGRPLGEEVPAPQAAAFPPAPPAPPLLTAWIREQNPLLKAEEAMIDSMETGVALAQKKGYPDFDLRMEYMVGKDPGRNRGDPYMPGRLMAYRNLANTALGRMPFDPVGVGIDAYEAGIYREPMGKGTDTFSVGVSMNLPVRRKRIHAAVKEAEYRSDSVSFGREAMARELDRDARMALFGIQDGQRRYMLYEDSLVPKAEQTYEVLQAAYASGGTGAASFIDVLDSIQTLLQMELEKVRAARDWQQSAAKLEYLLGGPWEGSEESVEVEEAQDGDDVPAEDVPEEDAKATEAVSQ